MNDNHWNPNIYDEKQEVDNASFYSKQKFTKSDDIIIIHAFECSKMDSKKVDWEFVGDFLDIDTHRVIERFNFLNSLGIYTETSLNQYIKYEGDLYEKSE